MPTDVATIADWLKVGKENGMSHVITVCDNWDHVDSAIFCATPEKTVKVFQEMNTDFFRVLEVYDLSMDLEGQLNEDRAIHLPDF